MQCRAQMERITVDVLSHSPSLNEELKLANNYLLIVADNQLSKSIEVFPIRGQLTGYNCRTMITDSCHGGSLLFGVPLSLHSDQGCNFESILFSCRNL